MRRQAIVAGLLATLAVGLWWFQSRRADPEAPAGTDAGIRDAGLPPAVVERDGAVDAAPEGPRPAWGIGGAVVDDVGRIVPGAHVRIVQDSHGRFGAERLDPREVLAGPDGSFEAAELPEGRFVLFASHDRHPVGGFAGPITVPRAEVHPVVVVLGSAAAVEGVVKERSGRGIRGATVGASEVPAVETDARGEFRLSTLDPRRHAVLRAEAGGYAPESTPIRLRAGEAVQVEIVLASGRDLEGRVLDHGRRVVEGARVTVVGVRDARADTDERGEFRFADLPEDDLTLKAFHVEYTDSAPVAVGPDDRYVELVLRRAASLSGTVFGPRGDPIMGIRVSLVAAGGAAAEEQTSRRPRVALSNAEGAYRFGQVVEGTYSLIARARGEAGRIDGVVVEAGDDRTGVDLRLGGRFTVTGRVVTAFTEAPVAGASVEVRFPAGSRVQAGEAPREVTDSRGRFRLDGVPADLLALRVNHAGHTPETFPVTVEGDEVDVGDLSLDPRVFGGVGMVLRERDGGIELREVMEGMPADRAGLLPGDRIIAVDGEQMSGRSLADAVALIRGAEGETVTLLVLREGRSDPFELSVVRELIDTESR